jgi:hypothetical protein
MPGNTANTSPTPRACSCDQDVWIVSFTTPLRGISGFMIFNKWEIKISMKNVSARQSNRCF